MVSGCSTFTEREHEPIPLLWPALLCLYAGEVSKEIPSVTAESWSHACRYLCSEKPTWQKFMDFSLWESSVECVASVWDSSVGVSCSGGVTCCLLSLFFHLMYFSFCHKIPIIILGYQVTPVTHLHCVSLHPKKEVQQFLNLFIIYTYMSISHLFSFYI